MIAFLGLFAATEYRKHTADYAIRNIVNAPIVAGARKLQDAVAEFESEVDLYFVTGKANGEKDKEIRELFEKVLKEESILTALFLNEAFNSGESLYQIDKMNDVKNEVAELRKKLSAEGPLFSGGTWEEAREGVDRLIQGTREVSDYAERAHREEIDYLLRNIDSYEKQRGVLAAFVLFSGLLLILSLLDNICRYRRNAERALAAEHYNALFAAALQSTRVGVLIRDMQKENSPVVFVNAAFSRLTGYAPEDIVSENMEFLFGWKTDAAAMTAFRRALALHETATFDLLVYRKDGSPFWSEWHLSPVMDSQGKLTHFVSLFTDTTAIRETQEDLIQAKQMAQRASAIKTNFLAMMSHEIRTPINGITGVLKLLEETPLDADQKHLVGIARTSSAALHGIINDILDYAKIEAGKVELFDEPFVLPELVDNVVGLFQTLVAEKGVSLACELAPEIPPNLVGDQGRVRQILLNLLSNAIKFTDKGFVQLRAFPLMEQEVRGKPGLLLRFEVLDSGIGISPEDQEKLFREFSQVERSFTRRFGGTGLGLAICRRLVELFGGEIGVESQPGKGSRFWFMIPLQIGEEGARREEGAYCNLEDAPVDTGRAYHILLVEDNDTNRLVARRYLEKAGFLVEEAVNGVEATEKTQLADFDLILMDVSMPEMDGMLATCHIRAQGGGNANVPIIALTAHAMTGDRELCLAAGMNDYLNKPLDYDELLRTLGRWLRLRVPERRKSAEEAEKPPAPDPPPSPHLIAAGLEAFPEFDPAVLQRMKDDLGPASVEQVTRTFLADSLRRLPSFEGASRETVLDTAHTLKSCSANCGLTRFSKLMQALESAAARDDKEEMAFLLGKVQETYAAARARLESEKGTYAG